MTNSLTGGGAERSMNLICIELTERGWPIALVPINSSEPDLIVPNCQVFPLERRWQGSVFNTVLSILKFHRVVGQWKPDVIVLNCDLPELFGALLCRRQCLVIVEHSSLPWSQRLGFGKMVRKILSLRRAIWVAVSPHLRIWSVGEYPREVLQNPLPTSVGSAHEITPTSHLERLIFLGRLSPEKNPKIMLEIGDKSETPVEIIGEGLLMESLQNEVKGRGLLVSLRGYIRNPWSLIQSGDLLIVPSLFEGDGLVAIEAMKIGVPMLLSDISDFRRFNLPEKHYCQTEEDFIARISEYRDDLDKLVLPKEIVDPFLSSRSLKVVGNSWEKFLNSI